MLEIGVFDSGTATANVTRARMAAYRKLDQRRDDLSDQGEP